MTDVFNIDFEVDGFRKNNLDWRKFRDTYNKVSATKLERGIKPLPLSLLLRLFGPQKVLNTYVITRKPADELDYQADFSTIYKDPTMKPVDKDSAVPKTLDFPGVGLLVRNSEDGHESTPKGQSHVKGTKRDALPTRPVFQRNVRVPGRYFPKPLADENVRHSANFSDGNTLREKSRQRTQTAKVIHTYTPSTRGPSRASTRIIKGTMCKATECVPSQAGRSPTGSGMYAAQATSLPSLSTNGYTTLRRAHTSIENMDVAHEMITPTYRGEERPSTNSSAYFEQNGDGSSEANTGKRLRYTTRQVTFPKAGPDFSALLMGRPKTLHPRDLCESMDGQINHQREPRSRTHVGFVEGT